MTKQILVLIFLKLCLDGKMVHGDVVLDAIQELDELALNAFWDVNRPGYLPITPHGIYESWCRPLVHNSIRKQEIVDQLFKENPILLIVLRITEMSKIKMLTKFCDNHKAVSIVANFNKLTNRIIPVIRPWYKMTVNTYLSAADPDSPVDAGDLICLMREMPKQLLDIVPPKWQRGYLKYMAILKENQSGLVAIILTHMNVDLNDNVCQLVYQQIPNPLGIKSQEMAGLLAWDRVMRKYSM